MPRRRSDLTLVSERKNLAKIILLHHPYDNFIERRSLFGTKRSAFMMKPVLDILAERKHRVYYRSNPMRLPTADLIILHANVSRIPQDYLDAVDRFPANINGRIADISKRAISTQLVEQDSDWAGPVIVKSDLNYGGLPEVRINLNAQKHSKPEPYPGVRYVDDYDVYDSIAEVPASSWKDDARVVEKFVPEIVPEGYAMRTWIFCGEAERCLRHVSREKIIKSESIIRSEPVEIPQALRELRKELGFDFGKFDFVMHDSGPILLDANKTPAGVRAEGELAKRVAAGSLTFADAIEALL